MQATNLTPTQKIITTLRKGPADFRALAILTGLNDVELEGQLRTLERDGWVAANYDEDFELEYVLVWYNNGNPYEG